jgi:pyruvate kinase
MKFVNSFDGLIKNIKILLAKERLAKKGDSFVVVAGHPFGKSGQTNLIKVEEV